MTAASLEPYDAGYRDGWHDANMPGRSRWARRKRRAARSTEYALGYRHGRIDGPTHPEYAEWWPDYARGPKTAARQAPSFRPGRATTPEAMSGALL